MLRFYINYSDALCLAGRYAEAVEQALSGVEVAADLGLERSTGAMLAGNAAEPLLALGEWDRASQLVERSLELDPPLRTTAPTCGCSSAGCACMTGRLEEAEAILTEFRGLSTGPQVAPQYASQAIRSGRRAGPGHRRPRASLGGSGGRFRALGPLPRRPLLPAALVGRPDRTGRRPGRCRRSAGGGDRPDGGDRADRDVQADRDEQLARIRVGVRGASPGRGTADLGSG